MSMPTKGPIQGPTAGATTSLVVEPYVTVRVIKGEIHNVLTVMRTTDHRYLSPYRFTEEVPDEQHPVVLQFLDLQQALVEWDWQADSPPPLLYLPPFCAAVERRDVNASVTGAALAALHKFLIYGFLHPADARAPAGMTRIAQTLLHCTFEETTGGASSKLVGGGSSSGGGSGNAPNHHSAAAAAIMAAQNHSNFKKGVGPSGLASTIRVPTGNSAPDHRQDEQVVLKLLDLAALVVRCSFSEASTLLSSDLVVGLLDTCLHVSHIAQTASPLLKAAATDALSQIVLQVFAGSGAPVRKARQLILAKLASLLNPAVYSEQVIVSSLTAVNIALETCREEPSPQEISILQNELCKYLLQWSTTHDLMILHLTLRVIFNLFQSIRNHLKVPLEVFLTSVHLRMLEMDVSDAEEKEVALESVLEFCHEPALMQDIYLNYDCDIGCTNLYERIVATLGKVAQPEQSPEWLASVKAKTAKKLSASSPSESADKKDEAASSSSTLGTVASSTIVSKEGGDAKQTTKESSKTKAPLPPVPEPEGLNHLNRLAMEGILAIVNSIARRVQAAGNKDDVVESPVTDAGESAVSDNDLALTVYKGDALVPYEGDERPDTTEGGNGKTEAIPEDEAVTGEVPSTSKGTSSVGIIPGEAGDQNIHGMCGLTFVAFDWSCIYRWE
jgi:hypothetical protein